MFSSRKSLYKIIKTILLLVILMFNFAYLSAAHTGRTDSAGGHYNGKTGEYHYHHGYPEHQHPDGICPYDYIDAAEHESNNSSSDDKTSATTVPHTTVSEKEKQEMAELLSRATAEKTNASTTKATQDMPGDDPVFLGVLLALTVIGVAIAIFFAIQKIKHRIDDKIAEEQRIAELNAKKQKEKELFITVHKNKPITAFVSIPDEVELTNDLLPKEINRSGKWGDTFTFYMSPTHRNTKYHYKWCPDAPLNTPVNAYTIVNNKQEQNICPKCKPILPDMSWVDMYIRIYNLKRSYNIYNEQMEHSALQQRKKNEIIKMKQKYRAVYCDHPISDFVHIPEYAELDDNMLPKEKNAPCLWGDLYTFYIDASEKAPKYHKRTCRYAVGLHPVNAYVLYYNDLGNNTCNICRPALPDMSWVQQYRRIFYIQDKLTYKNIKFSLKIEPTCIPEINDFDIPI